MITKETEQFAPTTFSNMENCLEKNKIEWNSLTSVAPSFDMKN